MKLLELTLPTLAENLALDEALLDAAEAGELDEEVLRLWEPSSPAVIVGRSSRVAEEVNLPECRQAGVPVFRRVSGGAAVVVGRGCLIYCVLLRYAGREHLRLLDEAHRHVLDTLVAALQPRLGNVTHAGTCDLVIAGHKFSGNSLRCKRDHLLYHGTLLYDFDLDLIERLLRMPPRQPDYREGRTHRDFVANLELSAEDVREAITSGFRAQAGHIDWPRRRMQHLVASRYGKKGWNFER